MDLFEEWLIKRDESIWIKRALTAVSYKNLDHSITDNDTAFELATYGDKLISFCYSEIMLDKCKPLSIEIEKYVSDKGWVNVIAKQYHLLRYIRTDKTDNSIVKDYNYQVPKKTSGGNKKESPHKYIATAVEAMIGAIYKETKNIDSIINLLRQWISLYNDKFINNGDL